MNKLVLVIAHLLLSTGVFAQIRYGVHLTGGFSNIIEKNYSKPYVSIANYYTALPAYGVGVDIIIPISDTNFHINTGFDFGSFAAKNNIPEHWKPSISNPDGWTERFYYVSLPVEIGFRFEKWVHVHAGIANKFQLNKPKETGQDMNRYTPDITGGVDFLVKNRFVIGASYSRNLTSVMKSNHSDKISYFVQQAVLKIGYVF